MNKHEQNKYSYIVYIRMNGLQCNARLKRVCLRKYYALFKPHIHSRVPVQVQLNCAGFCIVVCVAVVGDAYTYILEVRKRCVVADACRIKYVYEASAIVRVCSVRLRCSTTLFVIYGL